MSIKNAIKTSNLQKLLQKMKAIGEPPNSILNQPQKIKIPQSFANTNGVLSQLNQVFNLNHSKQFNNAYSESR